VAGEKIREMFRQYPVWPLSGTPPEWIQREHPDFVPSIYAAPKAEVDVTAIGEIKRTTAVAKTLRKGIQVDRAAARGMEEVDPLGELFREILSGAWWHGRSTHPPLEEASTMAATRRKGSLFGEPVGTSLTKDPHVAVNPSFSGVVNPRGEALYQAARKRFLDVFYGRPGFVDEMRVACEEMVASRTMRKKFLRVKPEFGGDPLKTILFPTHEPHAKVMNEAYEKTIFDLAEEYPDLAYIENLGDLKRAVPAREFNEQLTYNLQSKGYRGILYSPDARYSEFELKMFPSEFDTGMGSAYATYLDERAMTEPAMQKWRWKHGVPQMEKWTKAVEDAPYHHLKEHYMEIDLAEIGRKISGKAKKEAMK